MERNFTNENLERFLQQNAEGLRMRPSEKVWRGISNHLNRRKRRIGFGLGFIMLITAGLGYFWMENSARSVTGESVNGKVIPIGDLSGSGKLPANKINGDAQPASTVQRHSDIVSSSREIFNGLQNETVSAGLVVPINSLLAQLQNSQETVPGNTPANSSFADFVSPVIDSHYDESGMQQEKKSAAPASGIATAYPLTIESVTNLYTPRLKRSKLSFQAFFTPTVSYRRLSENKAYLHSISPGNLPFNQQGLYNINSAVTHKPDFGFEIGMTAKYEIAKNLKLRAGLQFNVNRYDIKTFHSSFQYATIRFNNADTLSRVTNYNNFSGYKTNWLENFSFQLSAPVGVEVRVRGNDKTAFGVATTVQPTYILGDRAYLISADYKNYMEVPWLIRRWNVNTSLETFVTYSTGKLKWQVGPQVRYQLLSSFVKKYPVKENLFDFGLKVGVSLNKK